ncbi:MAG: permease-like cell division protein FtsX [Streptococcaceae bacterium]|jgi:cell division transport system permease protein|nr:permease-like cell division protein FtsX [Streptococcaceae bacterium]
MIRIFFRHIWDSLKNLKRNGWMTVAAVSSVTITLILVGIFLSVIVNTTKLAKDLESNVRIVAYTNLSSNEISYVDNKSTLNPNHPIYDKIKALPHVATVTPSSKTEQLKKLTASISSFKLFSNDANPLYDAYIVHTTDPKYVTSVTKTLENMKADGIDKVDNGGINTKQIFSLSNTIQTWGLVGAVLLVFVAMFLISNTIRITIMSRSREIQIMRLVGAKNSYIRWPFFLEGAWVGLIGSIVPILLIFFLYRLVYQGVQPTLSTQELSLYKPSSFTMFISIGMAALGVVIGSLGATISMRRYLKA